MQAMAWWLVPLFAFVVAVVWVSIANRPRPRADPHDSVAEHERFRQAMGRQVGQPTAPAPARADGDGDDPSGAPPGVT